MEAGAEYAVISTGSALASGPDLTDSKTASRLIPVEDTLRTLQDLARWHRSMTFAGGKPIKTTTKELIKAVLSLRFKVSATEGNLNNSIGVPLTLLGIGPESEIAIVEMGASHPGDIKELVSVCLPNYGLITNVGKAHLLGFGSFEGVKKAKGELYDYIQRTADKVFINADDRELCKMAEERPDLQLIPYGVEYQGAKILDTDNEHPYLRLELPDENILIETHLIGTYNAANVMAALAVGSHFGIRHAEAAKAIESYIPTNNRSQMVRSKDNTLIIDAYNANPTSMEAAIDNFCRIKAENKTMMLGDMLELGTESCREHLKIISRAMQSDASKVFLVGEEFGKAASQTDLSASIPRIMLFRTSAELADHLASDRIKGSTILIKGSRGTRMETVLGNL